jgi:glycosyltransferase involved in cell wall biosynthesis
VIVVGQDAAASTLLDLIATTSNRPPLVLSPTVNWEITLFQRPQQLALAAANAGWPVVYTMPGERCRAVLPNLVVVDDVQQALDRFDRFAFLVFSTADCTLTLDRIKALGDRAIVVYDFIDEQHGDIYFLDEGMKRRHEEMVRSADIVLVTADRLEEQVRAIRDPSLPLIRSSNAVDFAHFDGTIPRERPHELRRLRGRATVGYYGALATWFDYPLVDRLAAERPDYDIVLIGVDYDRTLARSGVLRRENVYFLGPRPYRDLPNYLAAFDVATIPFLLNEITDSTSPIKLFEYMAGRKPIVTTDMRECRKYRSVAIGRSPEEFIALVDRAIASKDDPALQRLLAEEAKANSWASRIRNLSDAVALVDDTRARRGVGASLLKRLASR